MLSLTMLVLLLANFAMIGLLPLLFFRSDGKYNLRWLLTAAPFFAIPLLLLLKQAGLVGVWTFSASVAAILAVLATLLSVLSVTLVAMTVGSHRVPLALWHQDNDAPVELVTWGPYARIRHPFYSSFLSAFAAAALAAPSPWTLVCLAYGVLALTITARREEKRLSLSGFGEQYREYLSHTGRFLPRVFS